MTNRNAFLSLYLAKVEASEGSDAAPVATADAIAIDGIFDAPYDFAFKVARDNLVVGPDMHAQPPLAHKGLIYTWPKKAWFRGVSGAITAGNKFELDAWMQALGMSVTYDPTGGAEKATYTLASTALKTITEYYWQDGIKRIGVAARADGTLSFESGGPVVIDVTTQGKLTTDTDEAVPTNAVFKPTDHPIATDATTLSVDGYTTGILKSFELTWGNAVQRRDAVNVVGGVAGYRIHRRKPRFKFVIEEPLRATKNFGAPWTSNADMNLSWLVGATQYNRLEFAAAKARVETITPSHQDGLALITVEGGLYQSPGTSPFTLVVK